MMNNSPNLQKVEYENIKENDYNLIANRYAQPTVNNNGTARTKWEMVKLGDVIEKIKDGGTPPRTKSDSEKYFFGEMNWCVVNDIKNEIFTTKEKFLRIKS